MSEPNRPQTLAEQRKRHLHGCELERVGALRVGVQGATHQRYIRYDPPIVAEGTGPRQGHDIDRQPSSRGIRQEGQKDGAAAPFFEPIEHMGGGQDHAGGYHHAAADNGETIGAALRHGDISIAGLEQGGQ